MYYRYCLISFALALLLSAGVALRTCSFDPYQLYPDRAGVSGNGSLDLFYHLRLHKPYAIDAVRAEHLILGSSRSARLPPDRLAATGVPAYNASLPGATLRELRRMLEHAQAVNPLQSAVLGLDYYMFRRGHSEQVAHYADARLRKLNPGATDRVSYFFRRLKDLWFSLLSTRALVDGSMAVRGSSGRKFLADGTWIATRKGLSRHYLGYAMQTKQRYREFDDQNDELDMRELDLLLSFAQENGIEVSLVFSPMNGAIMNAIHMAGKWEAYLDWQRRLTRFIAASYPEVVVYGFETNPEFVLEPMRQSAPLFRDGAHYTQRAGAAILSCIVRTCETGLEGELLTGDSIDAYLESVDQLMRDYPEANPSDYERLLGWLRNL